jgi:ribosomal protein S18 acetylase RimI-like enzyme
MVQLNRNKRQVLRRIQEHFNTTRRRRGSLFEQASTIDIFYHPHDVAARSNYVTPRRGVAWVPGSDVNKALDRLAALDRVPRLSLIKGLFPPPFHAQLRAMGLLVESDHPILTYGAIPDCDQVITEIEPVPPAGHSLATYEVADRNAVATWLRLSMDGGYPDGESVDRLWDKVTLGQEMYFLASDELTIAGGAGVILNPPVGEILCVDTIGLYRRRGIASSAVRAAVQYAQARGCSLIFQVGLSENAARLYRRLGFVDLDQVITYFRPTGTASRQRSTEAIREGDTAHERDMAQPVSTHG